MEGGLRRREVIRGRETERGYKGGVMKGREGAERKGEGVECTRKKDVERGAKGEGLVQQ